MPPLPSNRPVLPGRPGSGRPEPPDRPRPDPVFPMVPVIPLPRPGEGGPVFPGSSTARVRFLNALAVGSIPLRILTGNRLLASALAPGNLTGYEAIPAGFRTFTFQDAHSPRLLLHREAVPLTSGETVTLAAIPSARGLDLVRVDDKPCGVRGTNRACLRCVNLIRNSPPLDLILTDGRVVFTDMSFREVTNFRRANPGRYDLYAAQTSFSLPWELNDIETVEDMPLVLDDRTLPGFGLVEPVVSFSWIARSGVQSTAYLMGEWNQSEDVRIRMADSF